ncbi:MAG: Hpt domain-containing protein [bacterium]
MSSIPVIDDQILEECYLGDDELIADVVQVFIEQKDDQVGGVTAAVKARDPGGISRAAHKLKGGLLTIGAAAASNAALELEKLGKNGDLGGADKALAALVREIDRLIVELRARKYI